MSQLTLAAHLSNVGIGINDTAPAGSTLATFILSGSGNGIDPATGAAYTDPTEAQHCESVIHDGFARLVQALAPFAPALANGGKLTPEQFLAAAAQFITSPTAEPGSSILQTILATIVPKVIGLAEAGNLNAANLESLGIQFATGEAAQILAHILPGA